MFGFSRVIWRNYFDGKENYWRKLRVETNGKQKQQTIQREKAMYFLLEPCTNLAIFLLTRHYTL